MKKVTFLITLFIFLACSTGVLAAAKPVIKETPLVKVVINGTQQAFSSTPISYNGRTLLGLREFSRALGVPNDQEHIAFNKANKSIRIVKDDVEINMFIGSTQATVNGSEMKMEAAPVLYKNVMYIPARFTAQALSRLVFWHNSTSSLIICKEEMLKQLNELPDADSSYDNIPYRQVVTETFNDNGKPVYTEQNDVKSDPVKNIEYTYSTTTRNYTTETVEYYEDSKHLYSKASTRNKWLKELKSDTKKSDKDTKPQSQEEQKALTASFILKEKNEQRIVLEGDVLYFALAPTKGTYLDVTKDKKSKCHVIMEYDTVTNRLKRLDMKISGSIRTGKTPRAYSLKRTIEFMLDEQVTVPVPKDLKNAYTIPKGFNEYYSNQNAYSFIVPASWILPNANDESPVLVYENSKNPKNWCGIAAVQTYMSYSWTLPSIKPNVIKHVKSMVKSGKLVSTENIKWKKYNALRVTVSGLDKQTGKPVMLQMTCIHYNGILLIFTYTGETSTYKGKYKEAQQIINTWTSYAQG